MKIPTGPKIIKAYPPNWKEIAARFPIKGVPNILYAFGDRIYNPSNVKVEPWIRAHEGVHCERQLASNVSIWWSNYLHCLPCRLEEEVLAHEAEFLAFKKDNKALKRVQNYLDMMVHRLSGPIYGHMCTEEEAKLYITGGWNAVYQA